MSNEIAKIFDAACDAEAAKRKTAKPHRERPYNQPQAMTVQELIADLSKRDPDAGVYFMVGDDDEIKACKYINESPYYNEIYLDGERENQP